MKRESRREAYTCRICGEEFVGRALGGHMRKHYSRGEGTKPSFAEVLRTELTQRQKCMLSEAEPQPQSLDVSAVAAELLGKVVSVINEKSGHLNEIAALRTQVLDLECRLKKANEERDRTIRIHNEAVTQQNGGRLPTIDSVVSALRRDHVRGKTL